MSPTKNGEIIAATAVLPYARPICVASNRSVCPRYVPRVANHAPQMKYWRNIIAETRTRTLPMRCRGMWDGPVTFNRELLPQFLLQAIPYCRADSLGSWRPPRLPRRLKPPAGTATSPVNEASTTASRCLSAPHFRTFALSHFRTFALSHFRRHALTHFRSSQRPDLDVPV